jgi:hypothetical protein
MTRSSWASGLAVLALPLALTLSSTTALAQGSAQDTAVARALFRDARKLMESGRYTDACPKLEESQRLDPGIGTQFNLADCWEHTGRTASAWALFLDVASATRAVGQTDREAVARDRAEKLEKKLSRLALRVEETDPGLEIRRDGAILGRPSWGTEVPVDPGTRTIEASAPGKRSWSTRIAVPASGAVTTVTIPKLEAAPASEPSAPGGEAATTSGTPESGSEAHDGPGRSSGNGQRVVALGLGGVGVVGLAVGTFFLLRYESKNSDAEKVCPASTECEPGDQITHDGLVQEAKDAAPFVYVGFGVGAAALTAAAIVYLTAPSGGSAARTPSSRWVAAPVLGENGTWGGVVQGRF